MKLAQVAQIGFIVAAAVGVFSFVRAAQNDSRHSNCQALCAFRPTYAAMDRKVPDFELPDMNGKMVRFSDYLGSKPVVLNFWTKTCEPCLEEMPGLQEMAGILAKEGVKVVTVCTDDGPDDIRDTLKVVLGGQEPNFDILFDPDTEVVADMFGTTLYPETWILDANGVVRVRIDGKKDWSPRPGLPSDDPALALEIIEMVGRPLGCPVEFTAGRMTKHADICECSDTGKSCIAHSECCDPNASCIKGKCSLEKPPKRRRPPTTPPQAPPTSTSKPSGAPAGTAAKNAMPATPSTATPASSN